MQLSSPPGPLTGPPPLLPLAPRAGATTSTFRPHVLHIAQPVDGGVARVVLDLVTAHRTAGLRTSVACPFGGPLATGARARGGEVHRWEATRSPGRSLPDEVRRLARLITEVAPDVVHAHSAKAGLAARLALRGRLPTVFQPHAWSFEAVGGTTARLALAWERYGTRWATRTVCVSDAECRTGNRAGIRACWTVIPNGVDTERFSPAAPGDPGLATPLGAGRQGGPLVVCVARLCPQKGQDVLLRAWPEVVRQVPGATLVFVGHGPDGERLRLGAPRSVRFAGTTSAPEVWYRAADLVVLPSRWEGMALAPLEAMACGRPVLVTDVDGARESLPPGHAPYCLIPPENPGALARAAVALLLDAPLRGRLGAQARQHVLATHDVRRTAAAMTAVYHELLDPPGANPQHPMSGERGTHPFQRREPIAT